MSSGNILQSRWSVPILLLLLAILVGLSTLFAPNPQANEPLANRSIYNNAASGYRAWWLACQKSGLGIVPWEKPFDKLDTLPEKATMLIVDPFTFSHSTVIYGEKEAQATLDWVRQGNTLVLLDDFHRFGSHYVAEQILTRVKTLHREEPQPSDGSPEEASPASSTLLHPVHNGGSGLDVFVTQPIVTRSVLGFRAHGREVNQEAWEPVLLDAEDNPLLIRMPYGKGTLILGTTTDLGENGLLHRPANDNYQYLANLLRREGKLVFINEYVHAYEEAGDLMSYLGQKTPLGVIFVQLVLGFMVLLWLSFMRWTPKPKGAGRSAALTEGNSLEAYIHSMARIYSRAHAASLALEPQVRRIEVLLRQRHRLTLDDETHLKHLLGTSPGDYSSKEDSPESLLDALKQARQVIREQGRLSHRDLLRLARQMTLIEERLQYERHPTHVRPR